MKNINIKTSFKTFVVISLLSSAVTNYADDTEVFYSVNVSRPNLLFVLDNSGSMRWDADGSEPDGSQGDPNHTPGWQGPSRMTILQNSVTAVLAAATNPVNIGLMRYGPGANTINGNWEANTTTENIRTHGVSGVSFPLTDISASANSVIATAADATPMFPNPGTVPAANVSVRNYVASIVNNWSETGGTPITGALYEAALYYRGEKVHYGQSVPGSIVGAHPSTYSGNAITTDITGGANPRNNATAPNYIRPITASCQKNYIALLSDGSPSYYYNNNISGQGVGWSQERGPFATAMQGNTGFSTLASAITGCADVPGGGFTAGKCGPEITNYLATNDNVADISATNPNGLDFMQTIDTFTVGLGVAPGSNTEQYLQSLETIDDDLSTPEIEDGYFPASNQAALVTAFTDIINKVSKPSGTLASPGYSVNVKSGLEHEKDIYIPVFDRKSTSRWSGNLKKFTLVDVNGKRKIRGQNNLDAVDELGGFTASAWDEWSNSASADGLAIDQGGVASLLDNPQEGSNGRKLYSNLTANSDLTASGNEIKKSNFASLTDADLGIVPSTDDAGYRQTLSNFIRGWKDGIDSQGHNGSGHIASRGHIPGEARKHMGDMLHSEPLVITYDNGTDDGNGNIVGKEQYIFAGTNEGYLHAFDTATGEEIFAFMPKELLKNIDPQYLNAGTEKDHKYGIDGALTYWKDPADGKRYLYFGLRRGGSSYYALDITSVDSPKLKWVISSDNYTSMGQSWSAPYLAKVGVGSTATATPAVIFTGGYDDLEDRDDALGDVADSKTAVTTTKGNDVFIFNAKTGAYIWSLQESDIGDGEIVNSIPGGARILDTNYNGMVDRMYFGDTGGFVWRLDLSEHLITSGDAESQLYKFAQLGNGNSRKFYNEPDVAVMKLKGKTTFVVSIGSGFRAHPMDKEISDKFFMLLDKTPFAPRIETDDDGNETLIDPITIANTDLADINILGAGGVTQRSNITNNSNKDGWVVNFLTDGEKVLATAVTFDGIVTFTTLVPETLVDPNFPNIDLCAAPATQGRLYAINIFTGEAGLDLNEDGVIDDSDISALVAKGEIPGKPQQIVNTLEVENVIGDDGAPTGDKSCTHPVDIRIGKKLSQATGYDTCRLESVYWSDPVPDQ